MRTWVIWEVVDVGVVEGEVGRVVEHRVRVWSGKGFWVIWGVVGEGGELTRFGGASWRVGLGGKRRVLKGGRGKKKKMKVRVVGFRRGKGFGCL